MSVCDICDQPHNNNTTNIQFGCVIKNREDK